MHALAGLLDCVKSGIGFEIVMIDLPYEAGLSRVTHPGDHARRLAKHLRIASFVHRAKSLISSELPFAHEIGKIANVAVALRQRLRKFVSALRTGSHIMLRPVVVDGLPVLLRHHAL